MSLLLLLQATSPSFWNIKATDVVQLIGTGVMIWVVAKAPKWAVEAQWEIQRMASDRDRRMQLFRSLMSTRAHRLHVNHVMALNTIGVEFSSDSIEDRDIRAAWKEYLDRLSARRDENPVLWDQRTHDGLANLLQRMGRSLGIDRDISFFKEEVYTPTAHGEMAIAEIETATNWARVVKGEQPLHMVIHPPPAHE
jgi:hypothetical protein